MLEIRIDSIDDPRISVYRDLPKSNLSRHSGRFIAEGQHLVGRLLASDYQTESILTSETHLDGLPPSVPAMVPVYVVDKSLIREIVGFRFHRGMLACGLRQPYLSVRQIVPPLPEPVTLVLLAQIQDPENVGATLRACAAFGIGGVVLGPHCADPLSRRVVRVSMGAVWKLNLAVSDDLAGDVAWLQNEAAVEVAATVLDPLAEPLARARRGRRIALLFGSEGHGLDTKLINRCARRLTIPMQLSTDSLNVSMAAGIFLYHFACLGETETP
jgi:tRNA G18 (ribose-2'-O)-methylase SpoU